MTGATTSATTGAEAPVHDRFAAARAVADAVLYEGYLLYPYRASATKNQLRWQFGVLVPRGFAALEPSERSQTRTEIVIDPGDAPTLAVRVRFLQLQERLVDIDGAAALPWDEGCAHEIDIDPLPLHALVGGSRAITFSVAGGEEVVIDGAGRTTRRRAPVYGKVDVSVGWAELPGGLLRVAVTLSNEVEWRPMTATRSDAVRRSLVGAHLLLAVTDATVISSIDPPDEARPAVAACVNDGTFPVLVDDGHGADVVLSSPIILYDHPTVAPESIGDMFDATEIDEILALRVLTLTDAEKAEARLTDAKAAAIIDRCDDMPPELWARLHGALRSLRPLDVAEAAEPAEPAEPVAVADEPVPWWDPSVDASFDPFTDTLMIGTTTIAAGTAVRLRPARRADAQDMFLDSMDATVGGVFTDLDGEVLVAVTLDDDPASEALAWQGRYLFFHPDEIEVRVS